MHDILTFIQKIVNRGKIQSIHTLLPCSRRVAGLQAKPTFTALVSESQAQNRVLIQNAAIQCHLIEAII